MSENRRKSIWDVVSFLFFMHVQQNNELQFPASLFSRPTKKKDLSLWVKYAFYRSLELKGVRHGILPSHSFKRIAEHLDLSLRSVQRDLKALASNGFATRFKDGYKLNSKLKSKHNNVRIPVELCKQLTNSELVIRELIDRSIQSKRYIRTRNGAENRYYYSPQNSGESVSLSELAKKSVYYTSTISKTIKSLESKTNLSVSRRKIVKDGLLWNAVNEYSFNKQPKPLNNTVKKQPTNITDWFKSLVESKKESFIILGLVSEYYSNRKVPYTHYNSILNRIVKKGLAKQLIPQEHWNTIAVKDKTDWFTKQSYQYFFFDKDGKSKVARYVFLRESLERTRIEMKELYEKSLALASANDGTLYNSTYSI